MNSFSNLRTIQLILLFGVLGCSKPREKQEAPDAKEVIHDTVYLYRSDAAAAPYINDFERIHVDSLDAVRRVTKLKHSSETRLLGDIDTSIRVRAERLAIRLYTRAAGPLEIEETHGIYWNVMVSVSEYGEYETSQAFTVGPFLSPKIKGSGQDFGDHYEIEVNHGFNNAKKTRLAIYLDKVLILQ